MTKQERLKSLTETLENLVANPIGLARAARFIAAARFVLKQEDNPLFLPFVGIDSSTDKFPLGSDREHWDTDALKRYDQEREQVEQQYAQLAAASAPPLLAWVRAQAKEDALVEELNKTSKLLTSKNSP